MQLSELDWAYVQKRAAHFTGRGWLFTRLERFLSGPPGVFLLLGEPGTGKTAVAAQLALAAAGRLPAAAVAAPRLHLPVAAAHFCRAGQVDLLDLAQRLSDQLAEAVPGFAHARQTLLTKIHVEEVRVRTGDIAAGGSVTGVRIDLSRLEAGEAFVQGVTLPLKRMREAGDNTPVVLLVDALDESFTSPAAEALPQLLGAVEYAHLVVTARPDHRAVGWLEDRAEHVDLLADAPTGSDDVLEYLHRQLTPQGEPGAMAVLARRIAELSSGNFLYAFYVVDALSRAQVLAGLDDATARQVPLPEGGLPGVYRDFLRRELWRDDRAWSTRFRPVLAPLTVAQDEGLTTEQLRLVAERLGEKSMTRTAVREVTQAARQFLDGLVPDGPFRVYHQSFANFLLDPEQNPDFLIDAAETHDAIVAAYAATDPLSWDRYARRNLALHAREVGRLDYLLEDARFLVVADPARLAVHLSAAHSTPARVAATVYRQAAHDLTALGPAGRASQLELYAQRLGHRTLAARLAEAAPHRPWRTRWSHGRPIADHQTLTGHTDWVPAVAVGALPDGTPVIVSGGDRTVRVWRLADGTPVGDPITGHFRGVRAVAVAALPDGTPVIVSGGSDRTVRVWRLADGTPVGDPITGHFGPVSAVAVGALPDGTPVIVSGSGGYDGDRTVRVWRLADGTPVGDPITGHFDEVSAVAVAALPDGTPVIVSGSGDGTVRVWRLADGTPSGDPITGHTNWVWAVAVGGAAGRHPGDRQRRRHHGAGVAAGRRRPGRRPHHRPHQLGVRGGGGDAAGRHPGDRQRQLGPHGAGVAAGRRRPGRRPAQGPYRRSAGGGGGGAAGRHPGDRQRRLRPHGAGVAAGRRRPGRRPHHRPHQLGVRSGGGGAAGRHPGDRQRQRRRHGAGVAAGRRHPVRRPHRPHQLGVRGGGGDAAGRHPGDRQRERRRHGAGVAAGRRRPGRRPHHRPHW